MTTENNPADKAAESAIHPVNKALIGLHPVEMLAQLGALPWQEVTATQRITFVRNFERFGHVQGAAAAAKSAAGPVADQPTSPRGVEQLDGVRLPAAAKGLQGAARIDAARRVIAANAAKVELEVMMKNGGDPESNRGYKLSETIRRGWGGSP